MNTTDRKTVLLKACLDMLEKVDEAPYIITPFETTVFYDGVECDAECLMADIKHELDAST